MYKQVTLLNFFGIFIKLKKKNFILIKIKMVN